MYGICILYADQGYSVVVSSYDKLTYDNLVYSIWQGRRGADPLSDIFPINFPMAKLRPLPLSADLLSFCSLLFHCDFSEKHLILFSFLNIIDCGRSNAMKYLSTTQAAELWGLSARRVALLCEQGRIEGVQKSGSRWIIPENAKKPDDARIKSGKYIKSKKEDIPND
jgi:hypothetical protein